MGNWYKLSSINPWSIFKDVKYNKEKKKYYDITVSYSSLVKFIEEATDNVLFVARVSTVAASYGVSIDVDISDYGTGPIGPDDEMDRLQFLTHQVAESFGTLGDSFFRLPVHQEFWWPDGTDSSPRCKIILSFHNHTELDFDN
jgi:hypothetical protein